MWSWAHVAVLVAGTFGFVAIYAGGQLLTSRFMKNDDGENPARVPILISLTNGAVGLLFLLLFICLALLW